MTENNVALENPISRVIGKPPEEFTRSDFLEVIRKEEIERITFHYVGLDGKLKDLRIPVTDLSYAELILAEGERVDGSSLFKGLVRAGKSDLYAAPVYKSAFFNPFEEKSLDFMCRFIAENGELAEFAPDNILLKIADKIREKFAMELRALGELEFYLVYDAENDLYPAQKQSGYHASAPFVKNAELLDEALKVIAQTVGYVKYGHFEVGAIKKIESDSPELDGKSAEQAEIEFLPAPIEEMADKLAIAKWIVRNLAYKRGITATFAPKIEVGHAGTGMHVHMALYKNGKNAMVDKDGKLNLEAKKLIGGLCRFAPSLNAFGNSTASSYLRLVPNQEAPTKIFWSEMNRDALIRVPLAWAGTDNLAMKINPAQKDKFEYDDSRQTVELRSPDGSSAVHFAMAGIAAAVKWGLENGEESAKIAEATYRGRDEKIDGDLADIAESCADAADKLLADREIYQSDGLFPDYVIDYVAESLYKENDRDLSRKLEAMSEKERTKESRKILSANLHKH